MNRDSPLEQYPLLIFAHSVLRKTEADDLNKATIIINCHWPNAAYTFPFFLFFSGTFVMSNVTHQK